MGDVQGYNKKYKSTTLRMWKNERDEAELLYDGGSIRVTLNGRNKAVLIDSTTQIISGVYGESDAVNGVVSIRCEQGQSFITTSNISALISSEASAVSVSLNIPSPSIVVRTTLTGSAVDFLISPYAESSETITPETADLFDAQKADGYNAGDVVSYINENSPIPQFQTLQLYIAESDIAYEEFGVPSPEEVDFWLYRGDTIIQTTSTSTSIAFIDTPTDLRSITSPRPGHTVAVKSTATIYRFNPYSTFGGYAPFDGTTGRWIGSGILSQQNLLVGVYTKENEGNGIFIPYGAKVLFLEMTEAGSNYCTIEDESSIEVLTITVTEPSVITRIGNGYTLADFSIVPLVRSTTIINVNDADAFDNNKENGYQEGSIVSYISVGADAPFNTLSLYSALTNIPYIGVYPDGYVESPEQNGNWIWQGTEIDVPSNSGSTVFVTSITALRQITGYKIGDTVSVVQGFTYKYMNVGVFQNGVDQYPFDQLVQDGNCWTYRWSSTELSMIPKISYSNLKYIIDGDDYDGASVTLDYQEGLILLNASIEVTINGQNFTNQPNCIIYRNSQGALIQETLGGNESLISKTYAELFALVASNGLVAGQKYLLTDFRTRYSQLSTNTIMTGDIEPIILTAVSTSLFNPKAQSTIYNNDEITYDFTGVRAWPNSSEFADRGAIIRRIDSSKNSAPFDHRAILWRRSGADSLTFISTYNNFIGDYSYDNVISGGGVNTFGTSCYGNTITNANMVTFGDSCTNHTFSRSTNNCDIGNNSNNIQIITANQCDNVKFGSNCNNVTISNGAINCELGSASTNFNATVFIQKLKVEAGINNVDLTGATVVSANHHKQIFLNASGVKRLSYYDEYDQLVITDITA